LEQSRETLSQRAVPQPPVEPELNTVTPTQRKRGAKLKEVFNAIQALPKLRPTLGLISKKIVRIRVFSIDKAQPEALWMCVPIREDTPNPFSHKGNIEDPSIDNPKTTLVFGLAHFLPFDPMILSLVPNTLPEETREVFIKAIMGTISKQEEAHAEDGETS
jgi:hypothetical protein